MADIRRFELLRWWAKAPQPSRLSITNASDRPAMRGKRSSPMGGITHETRLRAANHHLQPEPGRRTQRFADVGKSPAAVRSCEKIYPGNGRTDVGRVLSAWREENRSLEFYARATRGAGQSQGQGQGSRPLELLPARCGDRRRPEES